MFADMLVGHLIGDYIFQNDVLAAGKKKSSLLCFTHCSIWTFFVMLCSGLLYSSHATVSFVWLLSTHFLIDRWGFILWWMRRCGQSGFATSPGLSPWSIIVVDNIFHVMTLWLLAKVIGFGWI